MAKAATAKTATQPHTEQETCSVCGSAICLGLSRKNDAQLEAGAELRAKFFAEPERFGAIEQATNVCSTTGRKRP